METDQSGRVRSPRKIDQAMTELCEHREWLRSTAQNHEDRVRIVGVSESMDILAKHGGRCLCPSSEHRRKP